MGVGGAQALGGRRPEAGKLVATAFLSASVCIAQRKKKEVSKLWQMHWTFSSCSGSCRGWLNTLSAKALEAGTFSAQAAKMREKGSRLLA